MTSRKPHIPEYDATIYAEFRPTYPQALYTFLFSKVRHFDLAWDCACGTGQATAVLSEQFKQVVASDISDEQIQAAPKLPNVRYEVACAHNTTLRDSSVDLVAVAQAMHWFAADDFFTEVKRVLKPTGRLAVWCYDLPRLSPTIDRLVSEYAYGILDEYWAPGRRYIQTQYRDIPFPFSDKEYITDFFCEKTFGFETLIGYLQSWSARLKYMQHHAKDPLLQIEPALKEAWGDLGQVYLGRYPIFCWVGAK